MNMTGKYCRALIASDRDAEPEWESTHLLDYRIKHARDNMGDERWAKCNRHWNNPQFDGGKLEADQ